MSHQGQIPDRRDEDFGLIETLLWTPGDGFWLLPEHLARLAASCAALGFPYDREGALAALENAVAASPPARLRVRLVATRDGRLETGATAIEATPPETVWKVAVAPTRFSSVDPLLRHKTTRRALYEDTLAQAARERGVDEVMFLNERDEVCESARCNVFLQRDGALLTPPLSSGLLPGTLRARLIAEGRARESVLRLADLDGAAFYLGNSVRGLVRSAL